MEGQFEKMLLDPFITKNFEYRGMINRVFNFYKKLPDELSIDDKKLMVYLHFIDMFE